MCDFPLYYLTKNPECLDRYLSLLEPTYVYTYKYRIS